MNTFYISWNTFGTFFGSNPFPLGVVVHGYVTIKLEERFSAVNLNNNKITLESKTSCAYAEEHCVDMQFGYAFWDMVPTGACEARKYTSLYIGPVMKVIERDNERWPLYVLEAAGLSVALKDIRLVNVCSYQLIHMDHPKLFILLDQRVTC